jgi:hypothetical protein
MPSDIYSLSSPATPPFLGVSITRLRSFLDISLAICLIYIPCYQLRRRNQERRRDFFQFCSLVYKQIRGFQEESFVSFVGGKYESMGSEVFLFGLLFTSNAIVPIAREYTGTIHCNLLYILSNATLSNFSRQHYIVFWYLESHRKQHNEALKSCRSSFLHHAVKRKSHTLNRRGLS